MDAIRFRWDAADADRPPVHSHVAASVDGLHVVLVTLAPGAEAPLHRHEHKDEVFDALDSCEVWLEGRWQPLAPGETLVAPAGALHGLRNPSNQAARVRETVRERAYARHAIAAALRKRLGRIVRPGPARLP